MEDRQVNDARAALSKFQTQFEAKVSQCEEKIRAEPVRAVALGVGAGFVLSRLPLLGLMILVIRLALWAVRPALLIFGIVKVADYLKTVRES